MFNNKSWFKRLNRIDVGFHPIPLRIQPIINTLYLGEHLVIQLNTHVIQSHVWPYFLANDCTIMPNYIDGLKSYIEESSNISLVEIILVVKKVNLGSL